MIYSHNDLYSHKGEEKKRLLFQSLFEVSEQVSQNLIFV